MGRDITTTQDQIVRISVQDVNDHPPRFDAEFYTTNMTEDVRDLATLNNLAMIITDKDHVSHMILIISLLIKVSLIR